MNEKMSEGLTHDYKITYIIGVINAFELQARFEDPGVFGPHKPSRAPLLRQSLDCLLRIAPRRARLEVLSGRTSLRPYPGQKPWAVLLDHFMVRVPLAPGISRRVCLRLVLAALTEVSPFLDYGVFTNFSATL